MNDAKNIITNLYDHYTGIFGSEILNEEFYSNLENCKKTYYSLLEFNGLSSRNGLLRNNTSLKNLIFLCRKKNPNQLDAEIPGSMIIGGIEILAGALVWILPFPGSKQIGGVMIGDGVRRAMNGVEEIDAKNKKNQGNLPSQNPPAQYFDPDE